MYRAFRIQLPLAGTNYNLYELLKAEPGLPADAILVDRVQELRIILDPEGGYAGALVYIGDYRLSPTEYGWVLSISLDPFHMGAVRGNSVCLRDYYMRTDTVGARVLVNVEST